MISKFLDVSGSVSSTKVFSQLTDTYDKVDSSVAPASLGDAAIFTSSNGQSVIITNSTLSNKYYEITPKVGTSMISTMLGAEHKYTIQPFIAVHSEKGLFAIRYKGFFNTSKVGSSVKITATPSSPVAGQDYSYSIQQNANTPSVLHYEGFEIFQFAGSGLRSLTPEEHAFHILKDFDNTGKVDLNFNNSAGNNMFTSICTITDETANPIINNSNFQQNMVFTTRGDFLATFAVSMSCTFNTANGVFDCSGVAPAAANPSALDPFGGNVLGLYGLPITAANKFDYTNAKYVNYGAAVFGRSKIEVASLVAGSNSSVFLYTDSNEIAASAPVALAPDLYTSNNIFNTNGLFKFDNTYNPSSNKLLTISLLKYDSSTSGFIFTKSWSSHMHGTDAITTCGRNYHQVSSESGANVAGMYSGDKLINTIKLVYNGILDYLIFGVDNKFCGSDGTSTLRPWITVLKGSNLIKLREFGFGDLQKGDAVFSNRFSISNPPFYSIYTNKYTGVTSIVTSQELVQFDGAFNVIYLETFSGYTESRNNVFDPIRGLLYRVTPKEIRVMDERNYQLNTRILYGRDICVNIFINPNVKTTGLIGGNQQVFPMLGGAVPVNQPILIFKLFPINIPSTMQFVLFRHTNGTFLTDHKQELELLGAKMRFMSWYDPTLSSDLKMLGGPSMGVAPADFKTKGYSFKKVDGNVGEVSSNITGVYKLLGTLDSDYDVAHSIKSDPSSDLTYTSSHFGPVGWQKTWGADSADGTTDLDIVNTMSLPMFFTYSEEAVNNTINYLQTTSTTNRLKDAADKFIDITRSGPILDVDTGTVTNPYPAPVPFVATTASTVSGTGITTRNGTVPEAVLSTPNSTWKRVGHYAPIDASSGKTAASLESGKYGVLCDASKTNAWVAIKLPQHSDASSYYVLYGFIGN